jgi:uncharacterized protein YyaL (SSP411 family)
MKSIASFLYKAAKGRLYKKSHLEIFFGDVFDSYHDPDERIDYLKNSIDWLKLAQDANKDGGVSAGYFFSKGWFPSYPETTGYIIATFLDFFRFSKQEEYLDRAILMADWLVSIQLESGAFQGGFLGGSVKPIVFNTGQALQGLAMAYKQTHQEKYLHAAKKAANWLVSIQEGDGSWKKFTYNNISHVYHSRVAWPLIEFYNLDKNQDYVNAGSKNIEWALSNQRPSGWFDNNAFDFKSDPPLHTVAYAIEGILESAILTENSNWLGAAIKPIDVLLGDLEKNSSLASFYGQDWQRVTSDRCLAGEAQIAVCLLKLYRIKKEKKYLNAAAKINNSLKRLQDNDSDNTGIRGGVKGSHPIWGRYLPFTYPNWAAKFFCDALILETEF